MKTNNLSVVEQNAVINLLIRVPVEIMNLTIQHLNDTFVVEYRQILPGEHRKKYTRLYVQFLTRYIADSTDLIDYSKELEHFRQIFEID